MRPGILRKFRWLLMFFAISACVDRISFDVPKTPPQLVVDGMISDQPGPYIVKLSRSFSNDEPAFRNEPVRNATVLLFADEFFLEELRETREGTYETSAGTRGIVGKTYFITIETEEGKRYVSRPETMRPVGELESISHRFEQRTVRTADGDVRADRFVISANGQPSADRDAFVRWRFTGTYRVQHQPEYSYTTGPRGEKIPNPPECSGVRPRGTSLERFAPCTCCDCWITERERLWYVGDPRDVNELGFRNVFVGDVLVNNETFFEKYHVQVEQMSLSSTAYEFFRLLTAQAQGVGSIFQPATGDIRGNIVALDPEETALGLFWATSIESRQMTIRPADVPYAITPRRDTLRSACTTRANSSNVRPDFW